MKIRYGQSFEPKLVTKYLHDTFPKDGSWIFVCSTGDLFSPGVPDLWIKTVIEKINRDGEGNRFLLQTKNPSRILDFFNLINKERYVIGTTLDNTARTESLISKAPPPDFRAHTMMNFKQMGFTTFLSLEPLGAFDEEAMLHWIKMIEPEAVEIGLENYTHFTVPPTERELISFITKLDELGVNYILKDNLRWLKDECE